MGRLHAKSGRKEDRPLTQADRIEIFRLATRSFAHKYVDRFKTGMTDDEVAEAMKSSLGVFGGLSGPDRFSVTFTGSNLRIWGGWHVVNHVRDKPLFEGKATIAMAREIYGINDPNDIQLELL